MNRAGNRKKQIFFKKSICCLVAIKEVLKNVTYCALVGNLLSCALSVLAAILKQKLRNATEKDGDGANPLKIKVRPKTGQEFPSIADGLAFAKDEESAAMRLASD